MNQRDTFINAVRESVALPECVRDAATSATEIETALFDVTYLEFLDQQVEINARGDKWSQRLRSRRDALADWCDVPLIGGLITAGGDHYTVKVDPKTQSIVHWEHFAGS